MKKIIMALEDNRQIFAFVILGLILILFPNAMGIAAPYILGGALLLYGIINIVISVKYPESSVSLGDSVISIVTGGVLLVLGGNSVSILGVIWAMISLLEAAKEIDEFRETKKISPVGIIAVVISIVLSVMLMANPFLHFYTHVRILGLEIIANVFVKAKNIRKSRKDGAASEKEKDAE